MTKICKVLLFLLILCVFCLENSNAALIDRGAGLIYDDVLNITWLQNANYIEAAGQPGRSTWGGAMAWADQLAYYDPIRNVTWSDWRLPTTINRSITFGQKLYDTNPTIDNEMAYMYYINLELEADYNPNINNAPIPVLPADSLIQNLVFRGYWTGTPADGPRGQAWYLHFHQGWESIENPDNLLRAWAVRDGDVASVPIPGAILLFGSGLVGIICRKRKSQV
jgi:hypothetical protein